MPFWLAVGSAVISIYSGFSKGKASKRAGRARQEVAFANAADLRKYAGLNSDLLMGAAWRNAQAQMTIGEANASAIERATARNLLLFGMQAKEATRRHVYGEKMSAGQIRARGGASGVQTNTGTPLMFLYAQVDEGIKQRKFMVAKFAETMKSIAESGRDRAGIMRLTASENAAVIISNAETQSRISILDAERQAAALERGGDAAKKIGNAAATSAYIGGIAGAVTSLAGSGAFTGLFSGAGAGSGSSFTSWASSQPGWSNSTKFTGLNPFPAYGGGFGGINAGFSSNSLSSGFATSSINTGFSSNSNLNPFPAYGT